MRKFKIRVDGEEYTVEVEEVTGGESKAAVNTTTKTQTTKTKTATKTKKKKSAPKKKETTKDKKPAASGDITAPMPGKILEIKTAQGAKVEAGDVLIILEAMKMENDITAPQAGVVEKINVNEGENVEADDVLVKME